MENNIYFFFIDDQGDVKNNQKWLILGGILIDVADYHNLSRELKNHNKKLVNQEVREIKWSDLSAAIYLKNKNQEIKNNKSFYYLKDLDVNSITIYIRKFFSIINKYNYQIILSVANKDYFKIKPSVKFVEFQIEDLMQRVQYEIQSSDSLAIFVHDSRSKRQDNEKVKNIYKSLMSNSRFVQDYKNIIDNLFIEDSHLNTGIQISDFIIGAISGSLRKREFSKELYKNFLSQKLRKNTTRKVIGYGIVPTGLTRNIEFRNYLSQYLEIN
jgi:hypothetical protein